MTTVERTTPALGAHPSNGDLHATIHAHHLAEGLHRVTLALTTNLIVHHLERWPHDYLTGPDHIRHLASQLHRLADTLEGPTPP